MPTYLTPGVYVEEIPSSNKPIEGVGTAVAAFVGLAPGGPINTPMRISNWTQFAKIYGDPVNPDNGPFMEGSYLAHSVYGFFQNGGSLCWIVRVGKEGAGARPRAALPAATDKSVEAFRAEALPGVDDPVTIELSEEPGQRREGRRSHVQARRQGRRAGRGARGPDAQEGPRERRDEGQRRRPSSSRSRRSAPSLPETRVATGSYTLSPPAQSPEKVTLDRVRGRRRQALRHGRPRRGRRGHDGRDAGHHDARQQRRRRAGPRPPGQDDRPRGERRRPHGDPRRAARTCSRRTSWSGA